MQIKINIINFKLILKKKNNNSEIGAWVIQLQYSTICIAKNNKNLQK